jgi:hypothetical protein
MNTANKVQDTEHLSRSNRTTLDKGRSLHLSAMPKSMLVQSLELLPWRWKFLLFLVFFRVKLFFRS